MTKETLRGLWGLFLAILWMVALVGPATLAARKSANEMEAAHKRGEYTTWHEEREQRFDLIRAKTQWYKSHTPGGAEE